MMSMVANPIVLGSFATGVALLMGLIAWTVMERSRSGMVRDRLGIYVRVSGRELDNADVRADMRRRHMTNRMKALTEKQKYAASRLGSVKARLVQAGLDIGIVKWWMLCMLIGAGGAMAWLKMSSYPVLTPGVFLLLTFVIPRMWLSKKIAKRQQAFTSHFPNAVDIMVRGLRAGMPLQESIRVVSTEIPDPVGTEFRIVMDQVNAGLPLPDSLERAYERLPTQELRFFATIISVQEQNGGNLAEILSKISEVLRGRAQLKEKAKALSGEARMSAIIVGALPFLVSAVLFFANREYLQLLWTTRIGNLFLAGACIMMFLGVWIMNKMGDLDV